MSRLEQLEKFLEKEPEDPFLNYAMAMELEAIGEVDKSFELLSKLASHSPDYTATYYHLGRLMLQKGLKDEALEIFQQGMAKTRAKREQHLLAELQSAYNNALYDDDE